MYHLRLNTCTFKIQNFAFTILITENEKQSDDIENVKIEKIKAIPPTTLSTAISLHEATLKRHYQRMEYVHHHYNAVQPVLVGVDARDTIPHCRASADQTTPNYPPNSS